MKNKYHKLTEGQRNELLRLLQFIRVVLWNTWYLENISSGIQIKREC